MYVFSVVQVSRYNELEEHEREKERNEHYNPLQEVILFNAVDDDNLTAVNRHFNIFICIYFTNPITIETGLQIAKIIMNINHLQRFDELDGNQKSVLDSCDENRNNACTLYPSLVLHTVK